MTRVEKKKDPFLIHLHPPGSPANLSRCSKRSMERNCSTAMVRRSEWVRLGTPTVTRTRIAYPLSGWFSIWKHGAGQRGTLLQLPICDVCIAQVCPTQVGIDQGRPAEVRLSQVNSEQIGHSQVGRDQRPR
jgi:hypothetical protein